MSGPLLLFDLFCGRVDFNCFRGPSKSEVFTFAFKQTKVAAILGK